MGDEVDGVPGIQHVVPGFGRKTALKLVKKHGSLEKLLNAAAVRTVGREYAQEALTKHADYLRRNYDVLALRRYLSFVLLLPCHPPFSMKCNLLEHLPDEIVYFYSSLCSLVFDVLGLQNNTGILMFILKRNGW